MLFTSLGLVYFISAGFCLYEYTVYTYKDYKRCCKLRLEYLNNGKVYTPNYEYDTYGSILFRYFIALCPFINTVAFVCDVFPSMFCSICDTIFKFLNTPLVK